MRKKNASSAYGIFNFTIIAGFMVICIYAYGAKTTGQRLDEILDSANDPHFSYLDMPADVETDMQPVITGRLVKIPTGTEPVTTYHARKRVTYRQQAAAYKDLYYLTAADYSQQELKKWSNKNE